MKKLQILDMELVKNEESLNTFEINATKKNKIDEIKKNLKTYLISLALFLISFILYTISLAGCFRTEYDVFQKSELNFFINLDLWFYFLP